MQSNLFPLNTSSTVSFNIPDLITKEIKLGQTPTGGKRLRLSTNFLELMGFHSGKRTQMTPIGNGASGLQIVSSVHGTTKVYQRSYKHRKNNPLETLIDIQNQKLLTDAFPDYAERVHIAIRKGEVLIRPLPNHTFSIRKKLAQASDPFGAFVALSAGVDVHCLANAGFSIRAALEYRPQEARDKYDFTETGALNILANGKPAILFNQDISTIDWDQVRSSLENYEPVSLLHISLQCDDFSTAKANSLKKKDVENLQTSTDLVYDALRMAETVRPAIVMAENVQGFLNSGSGDMLRTKLRKWGYHVHEAILDAREFGGLTSRKRYYMVATVWPDFQMPLYSEAKSFLWPLIQSHLHECRDVSHLKTVSDGISMGRVRLITQEKTYAPTVLKSQNRQTKDSIYIQYAGKYFLPSEGLLRKLNGIPDSFDIGSCSQTIASEIIGQSIEYPMHHYLSKAVYNHIRANTKGILLKITK